MKRKPARRRKRKRALRGHKQRYVARIYEIKGDKEIRLNGAAAETAAREMLLGAIMEGWDEIGQGIKLELEQALTGVRHV